MFAGKGVPLLTFRPQSSLIEDPFSTDEVPESRPTLEQGEVTETDISNEDGIIADLTPKVEQYDLGVLM